MHRSTFKWPTLPWSGLAGVLRHDREHGVECDGTLLTVKAQCPLTPDQVKALARSLGEVLHGDKKRAQKDEPLQKLLNAAIGTGMRQELQTSSRAICCEWLHDPEGKPAVLHVVIRRFDDAGVQGMPPTQVATMLMPDGSGGRCTASVVLCAPEGAARAGVPQLQGLRAEGMTLIGFDWSRANLSGARLQGAVMQDCRLDGARLDQADLRNTHWVRCDLSGASLHDARHDDATWLDCHLIHVDLRASSSNRFEHCIVSTGTRLPPALVPAAFKHAGDVIAPDDVVVIPAGGPAFMGAFAARLKALGVTCCTSLDGDIWLRDLWFKNQLAGEGAFAVCLFPPQSRHAEGAELMWLHRHHSAWRDPSIKPSRILQEGESVESEARTFDVTRLGGFNGAEVRFNARYAGAPPVFLPGGNLFVIDKRWALVGNNSLYYADPKGPVAGAPDPAADAARAHKVKALFPAVKQEALRHRLWQARKLAKAQLQDVLGVEHLLVLPQYLYHIDLQMALVKPDTMLVHSFARTVQFLEDNAERLAQELGSSDRLEALIAANRRLAQRFEHEVVEASCQKLARSGLTVVPVCGMLIEDVRREEPQGAHSILMNGLSFCPTDGPVRFFTADAPLMPTHKRYFATVCRDLGVEVEFMEGGNPQVTMNETKGGLRCMSNTGLLAELNHEPAPVQGQFAWIQADAIRV